MEIEIEMHAEGIAERTLVSIMTIRLKNPGVHFVYDYELVKEGILQVLQTDQELGKGQHFVEFKKIK
jgi:hypothetical protein